MTQLVLFIFSILVFLPAFAAPPQYGCRVKVETIEKHGTLMNNAGCVLMKKENGEIKFLLVRNSKGKSDKGWSFPGGTPAKTSADAKTNSFLKVRDGEVHPINFVYHEPAVCTAARETREETGEEVVVADLIEVQNRFIAFRCFFANANAEHKKLYTADTAEVKEMGWFSLGEVQGEGFLRFKNNMPIFEKALKIF